jgi:hypothetical protein
VEELREELVASTYTYQGQVSDARRGGPRRMLSDDSIDDGPPRLVSLSRVRPELYLPSWGRRPRADCYNYSLP